MITYKCDFAICCIANTIYVFGGKLNCQTIMKNCEKYDITTNEWRELP